MNLLCARERIDAGGIDYTMGIRLPLPGLLQFLSRIAQDQLGAITGDKLEKAEGRAAVDRADRGARRLGLLDQLCDQRLRRQHDRRRPK